MAALQPHEALSASAVRWAGTPESTNRSRLFSFADHTWSIRRVTSNSHLTLPALFASKHAKEDHSMPHTQLLRLFLHLHTDPGTLCSVPRLPSPLPHTRPVCSALALLAGAVALGAAIARTQ